MMSPEFDSTSALDPGIADLSGVLRTAMLTRPDESQIQELASCILLSLTNLEHHKNGDRKAAIRVAIKRQLRLKGFDPTNMRLEAIFEVAYAVCCRYA